MAHGGHHVNFACNTLGSYFEECQKNEIQFSYFHYFRIVFLKFMLIKNEAEPVLEDFQVLFTYDTEQP